jgi:hypothetical protein
MQKNGEGFAKYESPPPPPMIKKSMNYGRQKVQLSLPEYILPCTTI